MLLSNMKKNKDHVVFLLCKYLHYRSSFISGGVQLRENIVLMALYKLVIISVWKTHEDPPFY